ncbi:hypothetical protein IQ259_04075 [Fortiea sp. LEGE XX443]|uniref:hypothetical protein n=1 Tax=Fortiea sp. LEGE XX443 TaxID=1828611 RepID=UPI0018824672|nr:hypothetical protein [Fortiea sp. LEGE XX443]MBE9004226.1 hypothetical protein [Fortiea sp. LEGE XX443]
MRYLAFLVLVKLRARFAERGLFTVSLVISDRATTLAILSIVSSVVVFDATATTGG